MGRSSNYSNQMYQQLQEIMGRLDSVEQDLKKEKREHKEDVERLEKLIIEKDKKIEVLTEDNERLKRILNNNSSNSSLPPSTDKKIASANMYNTRTKSGKKVGGVLVKYFCNTLFEKIKRYIVLPMVSFHYCRNVVGYDCTIRKHSDLLPLLMRLLIQN